MNLNCFANKNNLFQSTEEFFRECLNIPLKTTTRNAQTIDAVLNKEFKIVKSVYTHYMTEEPDGLFDSEQDQVPRKYNGMLVFSLDLKETPKRKDIADLTRAFNRESKGMPVCLLLKYQRNKHTAISMAVSERTAYKQKWRDGEKAGKVIILRDIDTADTHAGHLRILKDLAGVKCDDFGKLHEEWLNVLNIDILNKRFYTELSNWYFWAAQNVKFPDDVEPDEEIRNSTNLIRLITRVIFIWFIKEKGLVPEKLFDEKELETIIKDFKKTGHGNYYNAILQNLFFGTLNQKIGARDFTKDGDFNTNKEHFGFKGLYRYERMFKLTDKNDICNLFADIPFLNGGLFDCLDKDNKYIDGFSRNPKKQAKIPDELFFGDERNVDLNAVHNTKNKNYKSKGLIKILNSYKFTVTENTPQEEDVALDPELLGKVFENLLASYNPETQESARKQSGSYYTPREIVNYMVDESLTTYLREKVGEDWENNKKTINAINDMKILDPACGSGAFPMGILHKMVDILQKLDPENKIWRKLQEDKATAELKTAIKIVNQQERDNRLVEISDIFEKNATDYGRKLFLIENCIFGIDIQPIAVQISKLRFFLSLVIEQEIDSGKDNFGIRPLPNLETKFVAANTLIGLKRPEEPMFSEEILDKQNEIKENVHKYFSATTRPQKEELKKNERDLYSELGKLFLKNGWPNETVDKVISFNRYDQNTKSDWFDSELMFGVSEGFDVVIGNPPYFLYHKERKCEIEAIKKQSYFSICGTGKINAYRAFIACSIKKMQATNGILSMIFQNSFIADGTVGNLRKYILETQTIISLDSFPERDDPNKRVFPGVKMSVCIFLCKKTSSNATTLFPVNVYSDRKFNLSFSNKINLETILKYDPNNYTIPLIQPHDLEIIYKISSHDSKPLKVFVGEIDMTFQKPFLIDNNAMPEVLKGAAIQRFYITKKMSQGKREFLEVKKYEAQNNGEKSKHHNFDRIAMQGITGVDDEIRLIMTLVPKGFYLANSCNYILAETEDKLKYYLGVLSSKLINWLFKKTSTNSNVNCYEVKNIPIPLVSAKQQKHIITLVDKILSAKKKNPEADTTQLEREIDNLVYALYDLKPAEISVIESA